MSTVAQIHANRANSQLSTGPTTPEGKAAVAQNNFRHGLTSHFSVIPGENPEEYAALLTGLREEHQPSTMTEQMHLELDTEIRSVIEARLPGHAQIPFSDLKGVLKIALEEVAQTRKAA
jgi:hypothetical protein